MVGFPICIPAGARRLLPARAVCSESFRSRYPYIATKGRDSGTPTPGLAEQAFLSDKCRFVGQKHSLLPSGDGKIRGGEFRSEVCKVFRSVSASGPASDVSCYEGAQRDECVRPASRSVGLIAETKACI